MDLPLNILHTELIRPLRVGEMFKVDTNLFKNINPVMDSYAGEWLTVKKVIHGNDEYKSVYSAIDCKGERTGGVWHEYHMNIYSTNRRLMIINGKSLKKPSPNLPTI